MNETPTAITDKERLEYAWNHFSFIAEQRMKTFGFYLIVLMATFGYTMNCFVDDRMARHHFCLLGCAHILVAAAFQLIEWRTLMMLGVAKAALEELERSKPFEFHCKLIVCDTERHKQGWRRLVSFRVIVFLTFIFHVGFGILVASAPEYLAGIDQVTTHLYRPPTTPAPSQSKGK